MLFLFSHFRNISSLPITELEMMTNSSSSWISFVFMVVCKPHTCYFQTLTILPWVSSGIGHFPIHYKNHFLIFFSPVICFQIYPQCYLELLVCLQVSFLTKLCNRRSRQCCRILGITIGFSNYRYSTLC